VPWDEQQIAAFLRMQFDAQHRFYQEQFARARFDVIEMSGAPVGRLYVDRNEAAWLVIDIALLPEHRNRGIGSGILHALLQEAAEAGKPVRIHVEAFNPAQSLYRRLGFVPLAMQGIHLLMEWRPPGDA
jgi:GNAT superfamily N-acetyltransferase